MMGNYNVQSGCNFDALQHHLMNITCLMIQLKLMMVTNCVFLNVPALQAYPYF
jgi:hypothetical protein